MKTWPTASTRELMSSIPHALAQDLLDRAWESAQFLVLVLVVARGIVRRIALWDCSQCERVVTKLVKPNPALSLTEQPSRSIMSVYMRPGTVRVPILRNYLPLPALCRLGRMMWQMILYCQIFHLLLLIGSHANNFASQTSNLNVKLSEEKASNSNHFMRQEYMKLKISTEHQVPPRKPRGVPLGSQLRRLWRNIEITWFKLWMHYYRRKDHPLRRCKGMPSVLQPIFSVYANGQRNQLRQGCWWSCQAASVSTIDHLHGLWDIGIADSSRGSYKSYYLGQ